MGMMTAQLYEDKCITNTSIDIIHRTRRDDIIKDSGNNVRRFPSNMLKRQRAADGVEGATRQANHNIWI